MGKTRLESLSEEQRDKLDMFAKLLTEHNERLNLTRIIEPEEIKTRHFEDSLAPLEMLREYQQNTDRLPALVDIGSGGGFPALVLAAVLPDWHIVSIEATGKKADFQQIVVEELQLMNAEVISDRAEEISREPEYRETFDFALNRAVGTVSLVAEITGGLVRRGGYFLSYKGPKVDDELKTGVKTLKIMGFDAPEQISYETSDEEAGDLRLVRAKKIKKTPDKYPREFKYIKKKHLGM
ncbi:Ribosomal RNA small subunit methyltransferase G [Sedimentisphaera cyanobacteriorum]|uniref:Ribosomal RNA small subunit methyltransferase G n=1 Tax=Sedimentisphaera cyanobacteriorum TaxID=1940790 RepID=A0A1Q2HRS8_9BACT|nr:16S rRNA (guanine(527)-N(7))-methyltransferase RsmG [Sedimentisphaera cyanobacteriorum]AQQ10041.1 Ribosomal RNA small subunit methyltransferase G [Sedimentisphaera cyanobacteriorum]